MAPFDIHVVVRGGALHLLLAGELDIATAPLLADALVAAATTGVAVVVDCGGLTFVDSRGAVTLLAGIAGCTGGRLVRVPSSVQRVLDLVESLLEAHATAPRQQVDQRLVGRCVA